MTGDSAAGAPLRLEDRPLHLRDRAATGRLLVRIERRTRVSRRDELAALARWSRESPVAAVVLPASWLLYPDFRALGFEDAGPLGRYAAPTAPGAMRRAAWKLLAPRLRAPRDTVVYPEAPGPEAEARLRERYRSRFDAFVGASEASHLSGVTVEVQGVPAAFARFAPGSAEAVVSDWFAPPGDPDLVGFFARETAERAASLGVRRLAFETAHVRLGHGLVLGGFLPARARARVLLRDPEERFGAPPSSSAFGVTDSLEVVGAAG